MSERDILGEAIDRVLPAYYVCERCAHYWQSPEWPDHCENCRTEATNLSRQPTADAAEQESERAMEMQG